MLEAVLNLYPLGLMVVPSALTRPPSAAPVVAAVEAIVEVAVVEEAIAAEVVAEVTTAVVEAIVSGKLWVFTNLADRIRRRLRQPWRRR